MTKNKPLLFLMILLLLLLCSSIFYNIAFKDTVKPVTLKYNDNGEIIIGPPFSPLHVPPFGTDRGGNNLALRLIQGFQYTFLIVGIVTLCRLLFGAALSYLLVFPLKKLRKWVHYFFLPFLYLPAFILVYIFTGYLPLIQDVLSTEQLVVFQICIFILVGIPVITNTFTNEMNQLLKNEFIIAARTLGASDWRIFTKHIIPLFRPRFTLISLQQITISFLLLLQLGVFSYYIGGSQKFAVNEEDRKLSMTGEWGGMLGESKKDLMSAPWIFLIPLLLSTLLLIFINIAIRNKKESEDHAGVHIIQENKTRTEHTHLSSKWNNIKK
ncbi:ABC transporter permease subunit [Bacillus testis]|uniref:ABC transporter permease subunit n=1 Tax=Bacillus testis TaxID=1622072 RepID=UPI00067EA8D3|nr:ABC transporter permease subunit [Bacillus testis]